MNTGKFDRRMNAGGSVHPKGSQLSFGCKRTDGGFVVFHIKNALKIVQFSYINIR